MTKILLLTGIIAGGSIYTILNPILLPNFLTDIIVIGVSSIWSLEGILPIQAIMTCLYWDLVIMGSILIFKLIFGAINGKPEMN